MAKSIFLKATIIMGYAVAQLVEALRCKSEIAGSNHDDVTGIFH